MVGSSPHTRGAPYRRPSSPLRGRIIPAYAGSTSSSHSPTASSADHPRIRGEHVLSDLLPDDVRGSSPHTRGALLKPFKISQRYGIIPAYAGSTRYRVRPSSRMKDHPRIRGEHASPPSGGSKKRGSSPHTRGAPVAELPGLAQSRIIPAYAGSTFRRWIPAAGARDHPRIRGEHTVSHSSAACPEGSSPHTRGARSRPFERARNPGIIPAYAGSTT